jgi:hypothetical protein
MKFATERPYAEPEKAARRIMDHARAIEPVQDGRIYIEAINRPMLDKDGASPVEYWAGLQLAIEREWLEYHPSGTYVRFRQKGSELFD